MYSVSSIELTIIVLWETWTFPHEKGFVSGCMKMREHLETFYKHRDKWQWFMVLGDNWLVVIPPMLQMEQSLSENSRELEVVEKELQELEVNY